MTTPTMTSPSLSTLAPVRAPALHAARRFIAPLALALSVMGCDAAEPAAADASDITAKASLAAGKTAPKSDDKKAAPLETDDFADKMKSDKPGGQPGLLSSSGGVKYPGVDVDEAVLTCMRACGEPGKATDESRTCELRCANTATTSAYPDDCTVTCMTGLYTCRADCSQGVDRAGDVATCGLNCATAAGLCLQDRCKSAASN